MSEITITEEIHPEILIISEETRTITITDVAPKGDTGRGIESFERVSGTGLPGSDDVYRLTYTDGEFEEFTIHQGQDGTTGTNLSQHIIDITPHPAYDDMQSLRLLFENGLV